MEAKYDATVNASTLHQRIFLTPHLLAQLAEEDEEGQLDAPQRRVEEEIRGEDRAQEGSHARQNVGGKVVQHAGAHEKRQVHVARCALPNDGVGQRHEPCCTHERIVGEEPAENGQPDIQAKEDEEEGEADAALKHRLFSKR